jgi:hypothetical protein
MMNSDQFPFSLTNQIEIVKVVTLFGAGRNQFEMIRAPDEPKRLKEVVARYNIFESTFQAYRVTELNENGLNIEPILMTETTSEHDILFFVNRDIQADRNRLRQRLFEIWRTRAGTIRMGSRCFPEEPIRFPFQMPSRGKIFR